jgi:trans-2,3-dihydro-3-hydroxyanthranilate isomerase
MTLKYRTLDVFTDHRLGGNPLAVFTDVPELPTDFMQSIAREFNLSETVFIAEPRDPRATRRLRIRGQLSRYTSAESVSTTLSAPLCTTRARPRALGNT